MYDELMSEYPYEIVAIISPERRPNKLVRIHPSAELGYKEVREPITQIPLKIRLREEGKSSRLETTRNSNVERYKSIRQLEY